MSGEKETLIEVVEHLVQLVETQQRRIVDIQQRRKYGGAPHPAEGCGDPICRALKATRLALAEMRRNS